MNSCVGVTDLLVFEARPFSHLGTSPCNIVEKRQKNGGETGIRTPETVTTVYMISNHAPSASSDISPDNGSIIA